MLRLSALASMLIALWASCGDASAMSMRGRGFGGSYGKPAVGRGFVMRGHTAPRMTANPVRIGKIGRLTGRIATPGRGTGDHPRRPGRHRPPVIVKLPPFVPPAVVPPAVVTTPPLPTFTALPPSSPPPARVGPPAGFPRLNIPAAGEQRYVPDEVLVSFSANVDPQSVVGIAQSQRLSLLGIHRLSLINTTLYRFRITDGRSVTAVIASFGGDSRISRAQPNYLYAAQDEAVRHEGDPAQYALGKLEVTQAHRLAQGDRVLVALIDSSVDTSHPDLQGILAGRFDAVKSPDRPGRHGTAMASAIAAHGRLIGVAPAARLLAARAFEATPSGARGTTTRLLDSLQWASDSGARVINMSFAGPADPRLREMIMAVRRKGAALIAAAGNEGPQAPAAYPAAYPEVIAVTATDIEDHAFKLANRGAYVAVAAPGVDILVAAPNAAYDFTTGTSVAAAHVSGLAALLIERYPGIAPDTLEAILLRTAKDLGRPGRDDEFGAGLANAYGALSALSGQIAEHAPGN